MERLLNVATPATAATAVVPLSVPPPGLVPIARLTVAVLVVSTSPLLSSTCTVTAGEMEAPDAASVGCVLNFSEASVCGHRTKADAGVPPGSYAQTYLFEVVKGMGEREMLSFDPEALYVVAVPMGEVQVLVLSPHRYPVPSLASRIHRDTVV